MAGHSAVSRGPAGEAFALPSQREHELVLGDLLEIIQFLLVVVDVEIGECLLVKVRRSVAGLRMSRNHVINGVVSCPQHLV